MNKATLEQYLSQAEDHIDDVRQRIERQSCLLNRLKADGHDTANAQRLMDQFEMTLRAMQAERNLIEDLLKRIERPAFATGGLAVPIPLHLQLDEILQVVQFDAGDLAVLQSSAFAQRLGISLRSCIGHVQ